MGDSTFVEIADAAPAIHDLDDVRYLLRYLNIMSVDGALAMIALYYDERLLPPKTRLALEELLPG